MEGAGTIRRHNIEFIDLGAFSHGIGFHALRTSVMIMLCSSGLVVKEVITELDLFISIWMMPLSTCK